MKIYLAGPLFTTPEREFNTQLASPDSGTSWECGYAYGKNKPVVLFRSDLRGSGDADDIPYNAMLVGAANAHVELPLATVDEAAAAIEAELGRLAVTNRDNRTRP